MNRKTMLGRLLNKFVLLFVGCILMVSQALPIYAQSQSTLLQQAIDARNSGNIERSIRLFNQTLALNPLDLRVKIELASSHFLMQEYRIAKSLALEVLDNPSIPPTVRSNINAFVSSIEQQNHQNASLFTQYHTITVFSGHDSNANVAPSDNIIDIGTLSESSAKKSSPFFGLSYDFLQYKPLRLSTKQSHPIFHYNGVTLYTKDYVDLNQSDLVYIGARAGIKYTITNQWFAKAKIAFTHIDLNNQKFAQDFLLSSQAGYTNDKSEIALQLSGSYKDYFRSTDHSKKGNVIKQSLLYNYNFEKDFTFYFSLSNQDANLKNDSYAFDSTTYSTSLKVPFKDNISLDFGASYAKNAYRDVQKRYTEKRSDTVHKYHLKLNVLDLFQNVDSQLSYIYEERRSNNQINIYNKNLFMATLTYQFGPH